MPSDKTETGLRDEKVICSCQRVDVATSEPCMSHEDKSVELFDIDIVAINVSARRRNKTWK